MSKWDEFAPPSDGPEDRGLRVARFGDGPRNPEIRLNRGVQGRRPDDKISQWEVCDSVPLATRRGGASR